MNSQKTTDLVGAAVVASALNVRPATVTRWARESRIPSVRPSRKTVRFNLEAVLQSVALEAKGKPAK